MADHGHSDEFDDYGEYGKTDDLNDSREYGDSDSGEFGDLAACGDSHE